MFSIIKNYIIYSYNDSSLGFLSSAYRFLGMQDRLLGTSLRSLAVINVDYFPSVIKEFLSKYVDFVTLNNTFVFIALILGVFFSFKLFKRILNDNYLAVLFSLLYSTSIFFIYRVVSATSSLYFIFVFPMTIFMLESKKRPLIIGLVVFLALMISNYYGFFLFITVCLWYVYPFIIKKDTIVESIRNIVIFSLTVLLGTILFFGPTLLKNLPIFGNYSKTKEIGSLGSSSFSVYRPINNWYAFSFRPWYFFIPPKSSVFFGNLSKGIYKKIELTNYYLADDYMEAEMAGSYMGWHFLVGMGVVATLLLLKKYKKKEFPIFKSVYENHEIIVESFFIIFCILLISGPPSFTVGGVTIYTPSYLLYYLIPVFRTLVRWSAVIYLFVLIINSYIVLDMYNLTKKMWQKVLFLAVFFVLNFVMLAIKIPVININKPPLEIAYLKKEFPESVSYAVYPKGDYYSIFWVISDEDLIINPVDFINYATGFHANEFSEKLVTQEGIQGLKDMGAQYLIVYLEKIENYKEIQNINPKIQSQEDLMDFFEKNLGSVIYDYNNVKILGVSSNHERKN